MGLKKMIRDLIPIETLHVLQKEKCVGKYVDAAYAAQVGTSRRRSPEDIKLAIGRIKKSAKSVFWFTFNAMETKEGYHYWNEIDSKIKQYKDECK